MSSECARRVRVRKDLTKLVSSPFGGWVFRQIAMQNPARADLHRHENVQNAERSSDRHEEITRDTCIGMVANECGPTLIASVVSGRSGSRYFLTVRGETSMPSFSFSSRSETRPMPFHERLGLYDHQCTAPVEEPAEQNKPGARSGSSRFALRSWNRASCLRRNREQIWILRSVAAGSSERDGEEVILAEHSRCRSTAA